MAAKQKNCAQANFDLYIIYKNGTNGVQPDLEKALQYLDAAAKSNFAEALSIKAQALEDAGDWKGGEEFGALMGTGKVSFAGAGYGETLVSVANDEFALE